MAVHCAGIQGLSEDLGGGGGGGGRKGGQERGVTFVSRYADIVIE